jgi:hypothetical protein
MYYYFQSRLVLFMNWFSVSIYFLLQLNLNLFNFICICSIQSGKLFLRSHSQSLIYLQICVFKKIQLI